jgi:hypothetical protein
MLPKRSHIHREKVYVIALNRLSIYALLVLSAFRTEAAERTFESGAQKTHLLELFTSEGCSSCPPAEAWLSKLKSEHGLWKDFVPLAFHVDYWDRLGWRDPFAAKEWTARQYQYSESWKGESVYNPGFVLDGREWQRHSVPASAGETVGVLKLSIRNDKISAEFKPADGSSRDVDLHIAQLGFDLKTKITAGENNGRNLAQDFVVLSLAHEKVVNGKVEIKSFVLDPKAGAIAAWITPSGQLEPIQAVGGWLR